MSHEIRTPMNGVVGMTEVLMREPLSADQKEMICTIRDCASALLKIIDDILDFSKIEAGKLQIDCVPTSIEEVVDGLSASLATVADARGVALRTYVSPGLPSSAMFDDTRLREILYNLVGNAIKFSAGRSGVQGQVALRATLVEGDAPQVRFEVIDNGIGMAAETLQKLFQPFSQAEASTTRRFGGTGLGLAICRRLVALMGGQLSVQSAPGAGSAFTVLLPLQPADGAGPRKPTDLSGCTASSWLHPIGAAMTPPTICAMRARRSKSPPMPMTHSGRSHVRRAHASSCTTNVARPMRSHRVDGLKRRCFRATCRSRPRAIWL